MRRMILPALALIAAALPCRAGESLAVYQTATRDLASFLSINKMCAIIGYSVDPDTTRKAVTPVVDQAVKDGIAERDALTLLKTAVEGAVADEKAIARDWSDKIGIAFEAGNDAGVSEALDGWYKYIDDRCQAFAVSPVYSVYVKAPANPQSTAGYVNFANWVTATLNGTALPKSD